MAPDKTDNVSQVDASVPAALAQIYRAVKAFGFYPEGHPQRLNALRVAHEAVRKATCHNELGLIVRGRKILTEHGAVEEIPSVQALGRELSLRLIKKMVFLPEVSPADLTLFLDILIRDPEEVARTGGAALLLAETGTKTIILNDATAPETGTARAKIPPEENPAAPATDELDLLLSPPPTPEHRSLARIIMLLQDEEDAAAYAALGHELVREAFSARPTEPVTFVSCVLFLFAESRNNHKNSIIRGHARSFLDAFLDKETTTLLLNRIEQRDPEAGKMLSVLAGMGSAGIRALIDRLFAAESVSVRKYLAAAVIKTGEAAIPRLREALADERWYVVRNAVAIMAAIGTPEVVYDLAEAVDHHHEKVMREAILGLATIASADAERILLKVAEDARNERAILAVHALGLMRSGRAVPVLLRIVGRRDMFLRNFPLKKEALVALAAIADPAVVATLDRMIRKRRLFGRPRWLELQAWCVRALDAIEDPAAIAALEWAAGRDDVVGIAARDALAMKGMR